MLNKLILYCSYFHEMNRAVNFPRKKPYNNMFNIIFCYKHFYLYFDLFSVLNINLSMILYNFTTYGIKYFDNCIIKKSSDTK